MNLQFVAGDFTASIRNFYRSRGTVFFTLAFPIILMLLFGAIFSGGGDRYDLHVANYDYENGQIPPEILAVNAALAAFMENETNFYDAIYQHLGQTDLLSVRIINTTRYATYDGLDEYVRDKKLSAVMRIPEGYAASLFSAVNESNAGLTENITLMLDQGNTQSNGVITSVVLQLANQANLMIAGGQNYVSIEQHSTLESDVPYIVFFIPGVIALTVMTTSVFGTVETNTRFRKDGILRKLSTTPLKRSEWIFSRMLFMLFLSFLATLVILIVGATLVPVLFGVDVTFKISIFLVLLIVSESFAFSGMGMIVAHYVRDEDTVPAAANVLTFPQMFLAGTFIPLAAMPAFLQTLAQFLPLYYVNEGLRDAMIYGDASAALVKTAVIFVFAALIFAVGVAVTSWKED
jgi:ABC-2 type transport system permease protein